MCGPSGEGVDESLIHTKQIDNRVPEDKQVELGPRGNDLLLTCDREALSDAWDLMIRYRDQS